MQPSCSEQSQTFHTPKKPKGVNQSYENVFQTLFCCSDDARHRTSDGALRPPLTSGSAIFSGASPSSVGVGAQFEVTESDRALFDLVRESAEGAASPSPSLIILGRGLNSLGNLEASTLFARCKMTALKFDEVCKQLLLKR